MPLTNSSEGSWGEREKSDENELQDQRHAGELHRECHGIVCEVDFDIVCFVLCYTQCCVAKE